MNREISQDDGYQLMGAAFEVYHEQGYRRAETYYWYASGSFSQV